MSLLKAPSEEAVFSNGPVPFLGTQDGTTVVIAGEELHGWEPLAQSLYGQAGFVVARCSEQAEELFACCQKMAPCVLILDHKILRDVDRVELSNHLNQRRGVRVLVRTECGESASESLIRMGCMGWLPPDATPALIRRAIERVTLGEYWVPRRHLTQILQSFITAQNPSRLTPREEEILALIAKGHKNREIAEKLFVSLETVRWHIRSIYSKLGVHDRLNAAMYAMAEQPGRSPVAGRSAREAFAPVDVTAVDAA